MYEFPDFRDGMLSKREYITLVLIQDILRGKESTSYMDYDKCIVDWAKKLANEILK